MRNVVHYFNSQLLMNNLKVVRTTGIYQIELHDTSLTHFSIFGWHFLVRDFSCAILCLSGSLSLSPSFLLTFFVIFFFYIFFFFFSSFFSFVFSLPVSFFLSFLFLFTFCVSLLSFFSVFIYLFRFCNLLQLLEMFNCLFLRIPFCFICIFNPLSLLLLTYFISIFPYLYLHLYFYSDFY